MDCPRHDDLRRVLKERLLGLIGQELTFEFLLGEGWPHRRPHFKFAYSAMSDFLHEMEVRITRKDLSLHGWSGVLGRD